MSDELRERRLKKQITKALNWMGNPAHNGIEFDPLSDCPICDDVNHPAYNGPTEITQEILDAHEVVEA